MIRILPGVFLLALFGWVFDTQATIYVNASAAGLNNGSSWIDAYLDLQDGLSAATYGDEVWVAEGTYIPGAADTATFQLRSGIKLYGGFKGDETDIAQRNLETHESILSGDILQDDVVTAFSYTITLPNALHIVTCQDADNTTVIDGFTLLAGDIKHGFGWNWYTNAGGGLFLENADITVRNCVFKECFTAWSGGAGLYAWDSDILVENCDFASNYAHLGYGSGIYSDGTSNTVVKYSRFTDNYVKTGGSIWGRGAGISHSGSGSLQVFRSVFTNNKIEHFYGIGSEYGYGAAIHNFSDGLLVEGCEFRDNRAHAGAGIFSYGDGGRILNSIFEGNTAVALSSGGGGDYGDFGAAIAIHPGYIDTNYSEIVNTTIVGNTAGEASGIWGGFATIRNCILWGNTATGSDVPLLKAQISGDNDIEYSLVEGLFQIIPGEDPPDPADFPGCMDTVPVFSDVAAGDLTLAAGSPCIDAGNNSAYPATGFPIDLAGLARLEDDPATLDTGTGGWPIIDFGPYEYQLLCDPSNAPVSMSATILSSTQVDLNWSPIAGSDGYQISGRALDGSVTGNRVSLSSNKAIGGLSPGKEYAWKVRARCAGSGLITPFTEEDTFMLPTMVRLPKTFEVYPNPADDVLTFVCQEGKQWTVTNIQGQLMAKGRVGSAARIQLNTSDWNVGIYLLHIGDSAITFEVAH